MNFIQIGANIGDSPEDIIWPLVKEKGWTGILIEPLPDEFKTLKECYKGRNCFFENCAITDRVGEVDLHINTKPEEVEQRHNMQACILNKPGFNNKWNTDIIKVPCKTLNTIFKEYNLYDTSIELLQIDTEGADGIILRATDFSNIDIKFIRFEKVHLRKKGEIEETLSHLKQFGYIQIEDIYPDGGNRDIMLEKKEKKMKQYGNELTELFSLGDLYVSDFIKDNNKPRGGEEPLTLMLDKKTGLVRLKDVTDPDKMYGQYWYRSGINATMTKELESIVESCVDSIDMKREDVFLDIACNDGTLLSFVPKEYITVGIDPADDSYVKESSQLTDDIIQDYFSFETYKKSKFGHIKPKIITTIAMFYDIPDPISFLQDINKVMDDEGLFVLQMSYTPLMLKQLAFDNICHEHVYYYSLTSLKYLLNKVDMKVVDCQLNDINGGSFRIYIRKNKANPKNFRSSPYRDVSNFRIQSILRYEETLNLNSVETYEKFCLQICELKEQTVNFIKSEKAKGKVIWGYGASTKGNTLLQWYGLDNTLIDGIAERSPCKFGLKTVGTNIPIYSEEEMRDINPDFLLILPWHFIHEFCQREQDYLNGGGKFIVPCPEFSVITGERGYR